MSFETISEVDTLLREAGLPTYYEALRILTVLAGATPEAGEEVAAALVAAGDLVDEVAARLLPRTVQ